MPINNWAQFAPARLATTLLGWFSCAKPVGGDHQVLSSANEVRSSKRPPVAHAESQPESGTSVTVYCAGCDGLRRLGIEANTALFKIGVTTNTDVERRLLRLGAAGYASIVKDAGGGVHQQDGFDQWRAQKFADPQVAVSSTIQRTAQGITVTLPRRMSSGQFEARLRVRLATRSMFTIGGSKRFTARDGSASLSAATEIFRFRPRNRDDVAALVSVIDAIITEAS